MLPDDLVARLEGKSSLGRLGLLIHSTAGFIDPGWDGHVTLELSNVANLPITIYAGMKIGQLSFVQLAEPTDHPYGSSGLGSKYQGQRGPDAEPVLEELRRLARDGDAAAPGDRKRPQVSKCHKMLAARSGNAQRVRRHACAKVIRDSAGEWHRAALRRSGAATSGPQGTTGNRDRHSAVTVELRSWSHAVRAGGRSASRTGDHAHGRDRLRRRRPPGAAAPGTATRRPSAVLRDRPQARPVERWRRARIAAAIATALEISTRACRCCRSTCHGSTGAT